jgi:hypothetical protein
LPSNSVLRIARMTRFKTRVEAECKQICRGNIMIGEKPCLCVKR